MTGTICIVTNSVGHAIATCADVEQGKPAGYTTENMQQKRSRERAWSEVWHAVCVRDVAIAIDVAGWLVSHNLIEQLKKAGWKEAFHEFEFDQGAAP